MSDPFGHPECELSIAVMVGLVPTIHLSASAGACGTLGPRDKPEDDTGGATLRAELLSTAGECRSGASRAGGDASSQSPDRRRSAARSRSRARRSRSAGKDPAHPDCTCGCSPSRRPCRWSRARRCHGCGRCWSPDRARAHPSGFIGWPPGTHGGRRGFSASMAGVGRHPGLTFFSETVVTPSQRSSSRGMAMG